jgi:hypothetical protein
MWRCWPFVPCADSVVNCQDWKSQKLRMSLSTLVAWCDAPRIACAGGWVGDYMRVAVSIELMLCERELGGQWGENKWTRSTAVS